MNVADAYQLVISVVRQNLLTERLFLASVELALLAASVALVTSMCRLKMPRLAALLWIVVLVKPLVSLCVGSPIPVVQVASSRADQQVQTPRQEFAPAPNDGADVLNVVTTSVDHTVPTPCVETIERATLPPPESNSGVVSKRGATQSSGLSATTWLILCWGFGVGAMSLLAISRRVRLWRILKSSKQPPADLCNQLQRLAQTLQIRWVPRLRITDRLGSPALAGVINPVILVPQWLAEEGCTSSALTWSLRHELMHWKLRDPIANSINGIVQCLFFFHPVVWWSARQWRCAMELACDRALVSSTAEARSYAEGLYHVLATVEDRRRLALAGSLFATRTQIGRRIEVLLNGPLDGQRQSKVVVLTILIVLSVFGLSVGGQFTDVPPQGTPARKAMDQKLAAALSANTPDSKTVRRTHVTVSYSGISQPYAEAVARTVESARAAAVEQFGFDMPQSIHVTLKADPAGRVRLFNDGDSRFSLTVRSEQDLLQPSSSGKFHIYGLCHEVGHLAMYRPIRNRIWMTTAAAEGWAHYMGSRLVDAVFEREGRELWPDQYDYQGDGTSRLRQQLLANSQRPTTMGAGLWKLFAEMVGDDGIAPVFDTWGRASIGSVRTGDELGQLLLQSVSDERIRAWWARAETAFVVHRSPSQFVADKGDLSRISTQPAELALDDGEPAGKQSIAGSGHAVRFRVDRDSLYLTSLRVHGARYGTAQAPKEDFNVWLCDKEFKEIAVFSFPYSKFSRGTAKWVLLKVKPTRVPREFVVFVGFNPTGTKGVFVSRDAQGSGSSLTGLPGRSARVYDKGDWMIRATVGSVSTVRTWKDSTGNFSVKAELQGVVDGNVQLKKADGTIISVPVSKLSDADQRFLKSQSEKPAGTEAPALQLSGNPKELSSDDGQPAGQRSFTQGFAVSFTAPSDSSYLTSVRIHGARYGSPRAPDEDFHVSLCDKDFKLIADFPMPYSKFQRGESKWVTLTVKPTKVPKDFVICLDFKPTRTKGVFLSHDAQGKGLMGTPGKIAGSFGGGNWMLRASVDEPNDAN